jgi:hypothetical protein
LPSLENFGTWTVGTGGAAGREAIRELQHPPPQYEVLSRATAKTVEVNMCDPFPKNSAKMSSTIQRGRRIRERNSLHLVQAGSI